MKLRSWIGCFFIAVACFCLSIIFFCPRYYTWSPTDWNPHTPESSRAIKRVAQLANPFVQLNESRHLEWRILFPVIGHYLNLPWYVFFALPHIFCLILLVYVAHLVYSRTQNYLLSFATTGLAATTSNFFTSIDFLGYFDSAVTLCVLLAAFSRKNLVVWAAATLGPWISERFIFAMPLIFWCQWMQGRKLGDILCMLAIGTAPYLGLRAMTFAIDSSRETVNHMIGGFAHEPARLFWGFWNALRWGWVMVLAGIILATFYKKLYALTVIPLALLSVTLSNGDYSRSMAIASCMIYIGMLVFSNKFSYRTSTILVMSLAALNFLTPAYYSFRAFELKIHPITQQLKDQSLFKTAPGEIETN